MCFINSSSSPFFPFFSFSSPFYSIPLFPTFLLSHFLLCLSILNSTQHSYKYPSTQICIIMPKIHTQYNVGKAKFTALLFLKNNVGMAEFTALLYF